MKVAVYTIAKNEEQFVERWYESAKDADYLVMLDTGSTDATVERARSLGITVAQWTFNDWRFDLARNLSLDAVPKDADYCIALDMDEVLVEGWRDHLEVAHEEGLTRPRYRYTWSWNGDNPGLVYGGDKIHTRTGYRWKHPVHEVLTPSIEEVQGWVGLEIHHFPDHSKSRGQYFPMLELAVREDPSDDRNAHYLAREYYFNGMYDKAAAEFKRHLSLPKAVWKPERAQSMRYLAKCEPENREVWLTQAVEECPNRREALVDLAQYYYDKQMWAQCYQASCNALLITDRPLEYLNEEHAWGCLPHDLAAISAYQLGNYKEAVEQGTAALNLSPQDERLQSNLVFYVNALKKLSE